MADPNDTWPEQICIPTLEEVRKTVNWLRICLSNDNEEYHDQAVARSYLEDALTYLEKAKIVLGG